MNIFSIDLCPVKSAIQLHDRHVVKMILESAQMLSTTHRIFEPNNNSVYKSSFVNHPCTIWVRQNTSNYNWLLEHFKALLQEFTFRFKKIHKCSELLPVLDKPPTLLTNSKLTPFAQAMPDIYKRENSVEAYRNYYICEKVVNNFWTNRVNSLDYWLTKHIKEEQYKNNLNRPLIHFDDHFGFFDEIFVFGSNLAGIHGKGAALYAKNYCSAKIGVGIGITGDSYAIPTKDKKLQTLELNEIKKHVESFVTFTYENKHLRFFVTKVGTGLAGFSMETIAPLFKELKSNCRISMEWYRYIYNDF